MIDYGNSRAAGFAYPANARDGLERGHTSHFADIFGEASTYEATDDFFFRIAHDFGFGFVGSGG
jgi:hypothetical protein